MPAARLTPLLIALLLLPPLILGACAKTAPSADPGASQDQQGETDEPRFAVFSPAIGVMLRDLGFEDNIVGRHSYDTALSTSIPAVGSHIDIDDELLIGAQPNTLIFEDNNTAIPDRVRAMADERGWTIWTYKLQSIDDIAHTVDDLYLKLVGFPTDPNTDNDPTTLFQNPTKRFEIELPSARLARAWSPLGRDAQHAGRTLLLASTDPAGALGPGSFHAQMTDRLGITPALDTGAMWQELDLEDIITLSPDSIILFTPDHQPEDNLIGEPEPHTWDETLAALGPVATLNLPAIRERRVAIIDHPQALLPSTTLAQIADEIRKTLAQWRERSQDP